MQQLKQVGISMSKIKNFKAKANYEMFIKNTKSKDLNLRL